jgi:SAM-dependent methyltransferase
MKHPDHECIICSSKNWKLYLPFDKYSIWRCQHCSLAILYPQPTDEMLAGLYNQDYFNHIENQMPGGKEEIELELYKRYYFVQWLHSTLNVSSGRLLDIGSSTGFLLKAFQDHGWQVSGIEISDSAAEYAIKHFSLDVRLGPVSPLTLRSDQFDIIVMLHTFEHLSDPLGTLKLLLPHLKNDGKLIIRVPNLSSLPARWYRKNWEGWRIPYHLFHFSAKTLTLLVQKAGYKIFQLEYTLPKFEISLLFPEKPVHSKYNMSLKKTAAQKKWSTTLRKKLAHWNKSIPLGRDITLIAQKLQA